MRHRWRRVLGTPLGRAATALMVIVLVLAIVAPVLWSGKADAVDTSDILASPSPQHWAGTDNLGRDIFYRTLVATRLSVVLALSATAIAVIVGLMLGTASYLLGRRPGRFVNAALNVTVAFPGLLLALFFAVIFGVGAIGAMLAIGLAGAPAFGRLTQTLVASTASRDYVAAAQIAGVSRVRNLRRHILPNISEPLIVNATIGAGGALLAFAGLSFLGLGVQAPAYDWGRLLYDGVGAIYANPAAALAPGVAIVIAGLAFSLFGESIAKAFGIGDATRPPELRAAVVATGEVEPEPAAPELAGARDVILDVRGLEVLLPGPSGPIRPVRGVSLTVRRGESIGIVGESGSGKSLTALAISRLVGDLGQVRAAKLEFLGADLLGPETKEQRHLLGRSLAMVFQDPTTSFNPTRRMGGQLAEVGRHHLGLDRKGAMARAVDRMAAVRITDPERRARQYPHEFSGGMRQRAMIGMGLMGTPALIVADEPTTALDVTVQQRVLDLLAEVRDEGHLAMVLISHDVSVVEDVCDRVLVMYAGRIVEDLPASELRTAARHPYTRALVHAVPDMATDLRQPLAVIPGRPVDPSDTPPGCAYAPRCPLASDRCRDEDPALEPDAFGRRVACWHAGEQPDPADAEPAPRAEVEVP